MRSKQLTVRPTPTSCCAKTEECGDLSPSSPDENSGIICFSNIVARTFGTKHYGMIWGAIFMIKGFGDAVGVPLLAGVADSPMGWNGTFIISIIGMIIAVVFMLLTRKERKLAELEKEARSPRGVMA